MFAAYWLLFAAAYVYLAAEPVRGNFRLQILHNNDLHARFAETDTYTASCSDQFAKENKCYGGFARMKKAADDARQHANSQGIPSIFLNAGDSFQGTPYYTLYKWNITYELVDKLGIDVMTLGNHEFGDGIDNLVEYLNHVRTPVVCANLNITSEKRLALPNLTPSKILTVQGRKIGIIGYLTPETMVLANTENLQIFEELPYIRQEAQRLKSQGVKILIALGHSGFDYDLKIAAEVEEISLVVGGHSHTLLYTPKDKPPSVEEVRSEYPTLVTQKSGKVVPVVQAYAYCKYLGKLMVDFDDEGNVISATGNPQILDSNVEKDLELDKVISKWVDSVNEQVRVVKGYTRTFLNKPTLTDDKLESSMANLITDALVDYGTQLAKERKYTAWTKTPIALYQNGGIRAVIDNKKNEGVLTLEDLMTVLPFEDKLVEITARGSTVKKALEFSVSKYKNEATNFRLNYYVHFSGLRVVYDFAKPSGQRIASVTALCRECDVPEFRPLEDDSIYNIITINYLANGGDKFDMFKNECINRTALNFAAIDAVTAYVEKTRIVYSHLDNRVTVIGFKLRDPNTLSSASASVPSSYAFLSSIILFTLLRLFLS